MLSETTLAGYLMILIPLITICAAQGIKFLRFTLRHGWNSDYIFAPGHFPSAHSAFVTSLVICVGYFEGTSGGAFAVAAAFAFLTIYDAMRIRIHIGLQGKYLNKLVDRIDTLNKKDFPRLKERVGHYASEVVGGVLIGAVITLLLIALLA